MIQVFNYDSAEMRIIEQNDEPWFVAKDVCDILQLTNAREAIKALDDDERGSVRISDGTSPKGGNPNVNVINESGLYALIMRSNKPEAKKFRKWVTKEVLPAIRKHGMYATPQKVEEMLRDPDTMIQVLQALKAEREKVKALTAQAEENRPKVIFAEAVDASKDSILVGNLAKLLTQNGIKIGQNRLFAWLRDHGYLCSCKGERWNIPQQQYVDQGLFELKKTVVNNPDGSTRVTHTTKVTGKGQIYFINGFINGTFRS